MSKKNKTRVFAENNMLLWICLISSALFLGLYALIDIFVENYPMWLGLVLFGAIALFMLVVYIVYKKKLEQEESFKEKTLLMEKAMTGMMKDVEIPCMLTLRSGLIAWCSKGVYDMLDAKESLLQKNFNDLCNKDIEELIAKLPGEDAETGDASCGELEMLINEKNYTAKNKKLLEEGAFKIRWCVFAMQLFVFCCLLSKLWLPGR
jgi:c-di-AMP phosphodiesterase-like protein